MYRGGSSGGGPILMSAIAGIDMALWDIKGKHYGAPVHALLGGPVRDRLRVHQWIGGESPEDIAVSAREMVAAGYTGAEDERDEEFRPLASPRKWMLSNPDCGRFEPPSATTWTSGSTSTAAFRFRWRNGS